MNKNYSNLPNIVLEGLDRAGKSTIANLFSSLNYNYVHCAYNPNYKDIYEHYYSLIKSLTTPVALDRSFITEEVYGPIRRGYSRLSKNQFQNLLKILNDSNFVVIYVQERPEIIYRRLIETKEEHMLVIENFNELINGFDNCINEISNMIPTYRICPTNYDKDELLNIIVNKLLNTSNYEGLDFQNKVSRSI